MEPKTNYTLVGIIVLILIAGLISALLRLSVGFDNKTYHTYVVYMHEPAAGLNEDSLVKFNGVKVGTINRVVLNKDDPQRIQLFLSIADDTPVTVDTVATLITQGITGTTYLGLVANSSTLTPLKPKPPARYPVIPYKTSFFGQLEKSVTEISESLKSILDKENAKHLKKTLANLERITNAIAQNDKNINLALQDLPKALEEMRKGMHDVGLSGKQFSKTMRAGQVGIEQIRQQTVPSANVLIERLDTAATNIEQVTSLMRQNPAVILRGSAPQPAGPGE